MYSKRKYYRGVIFPPHIIEAAINVMMAEIAVLQKSMYLSVFSFSANYNEEITIKNSTAEQRRNGWKMGSCSYSLSADKFRFMIHKIDSSVYRIEVGGFSSLEAIEKVHAVFETAYNECKVPEGDELRGLTVFIGHGRSKLWRDLKDHLQDIHHIKVVAYETGARAGFTITEVLQDMADEASLALLVHTAEDYDLEGVAHARENVVHETGLFQGKLGFRRAIVLLEAECNEFSNIAGLQQVRFSKGNIREIFGDVLGIIRREFVPQTIL